MTTPPKSTGEQKHERGRKFYSCWLTDDVALDGSREYDRAHALSLASPFMELCLVEGLWSLINDAAGSNLDDFEEEDLTPEQVPIALRIVREFIERTALDHRQEISHVVAWEATEQSRAWRGTDDPPMPRNRAEWMAESDRIRATGKPLVAAMSKARFLDDLRRFEQFLADAAEKKKGVMVSL